MQFIIVFLDFLNVGFLLIKTHRLLLLDAIILFTLRQNTKVRSTLLVSSKNKGRCEQMFIVFLSLKNGTDTIGLSKIPINNSPVTHIKIVDSTWLKIVIVWS